MARYYFHLQETNGATMDEEGRNFATVAEAREAAVLDARSVIVGDVQQGRLDLSGRIEVASAKGELVLVVTFEEASGFGAARRD